MYIRTASIFLSHCCKDVFVVYVVGRRWSSYIRLFLSSTIDVNDISKRKIRTPYRSFGKPPVFIPKKTVPRTLGIHTYGTVFSSIFAFTITHLHFFNTLHNMMGPLKAHSEKHLGTAASWPSGHLSPPETIQKKNRSPSARARICLSAAAVAAGNKNKPTIDQSPRAKLSMTSMPANQQIVVKRLMEQLRTNL